MTDDLIIKLKAPETLRVDMQAPELLSLSMTGAVKPYQGPPGPKGDPGETGEPGPKGDPGDTGEAAYIMGTETKYQTSANGTSVPTGTWLDAVPSVPQGEYLWIRTVLTWNSEQETTLYSVSRFGMDGSGSVSKVNGISPDANGNVALPIDDSPAQSSGNPVKSSGVYSALSGKQDTLTFDDAPTQSSNNPVKSGGVYSALAAKQGTLTFDDAPTENSDNPVKSGGVYSALAGKQSTLSLPLSTANGGTGQTSLQATRNAMGLGNTLGALPVANGGTGATNASAARTNLGLSFSLSGTVLTITVT